MTQHKATVLSHPNIAFVKYWGARNLDLAIPAFPSISMTLSRCYTRTTVEWRKTVGEHEILLQEAGVLETAPEAFRGRIAGHLDRLRDWAGIEGHFKVGTENNFPAAAGLASSASGFSALAFGVVRALDRTVDVATLSRLARLSGSGSAARSVLGGYVEWPVGDDATTLYDDETCVARELAPHDHWDLRDVIALVAADAKKVSSVDGHRRTDTSPYWRTREERIEPRLELVRRAILERDIETFGEVLEAEAIDLHCLAMTSQPAIFYWQPATLSVLARVRALRDEGVPAYSTMDAGANVHVICEAEHEDRVVTALEAVPGVTDVLRDAIGPGPREVDDHLF
ncbi:MAG: diphosphomevalonate decarboxylase [Acidobacteriota bacterium]